MIQQSVGIGIGIGRTAGAIIHVICMVEPCPEQDVDYRTYCM